MKRQFEELVNQAGSDVSGKWLSLGHAEHLIELTIRACINAVKNADTTHAYTSFDKGMIDATIEKCVQSIKERFEL